MQVLKMFLLSIVVMAGAAPAEEEKLVSSLPNYRISEWAEWVVNLAGQKKKRQLTATEGTREHLLDVQAPESFRIRLTVTGKEDKGVQFRAQINHHGETFITTFPADPYTLLNTLEIEHGTSRITSSKPFTMQVGGKRLKGTVTTTEHTPEGGASYLIKQWQVPVISLGPVRLEYPGGSLELKAWGLKEQPDFPMTDEDKDVAIETKKGTDGKTKPKNPDQAGDKK